MGKDEKALQEQVWDLEAKLEVLRSALCKRCRAIDIDDSETRAHLQQCHNARKSISHTPELPLPPPPSSSHGPRRQRARSTVTRKSSKDAIDSSPILVRPSVPLPATTDKKVTRIRSDGTPPSTPLTRGDGKPRLLKFPFSRKKNPHRHSLEGKRSPLRVSGDGGGDGGSPGSVKKAGPSTTASGILIPQLSLYKAAPREAAPEERRSHSPPPAPSGSLIPAVQSHRRVSSVPLCDSSSDDSDHEMRERNLRDTLDYDADEGDDDEEFVPPRASPSRSSDGSSRESSATRYSSSATLHQVATQLLTFRQQLLDSGVGEKKLADLLDLSDTLYTEANRLENHSVTRCASADRVRRPSGGTARHPSPSNLELVRTKRTRSGSSALTEVTAHFASSHVQRIRDVMGAKKKEAGGERGALEMSGSTWERKIHRTRMFFLEKPVGGLGASGGASGPRRRTSSWTGEQVEGGAPSGVPSPPPPPSLLRRHSMEWENPWMSPARPPALTNTGRVSLTLREGELALESGNPLDVLEWLLASPSADDSQQEHEMRAFLLVYRRHMQPSLLLMTLMKRWEDHLRLRLPTHSTVRFLERWIEHHFMSDFGMSQHRVMAQQLWRFLEDHVKNTEALRMLTRSWDNQHFVRTREARRHPIPVAITPICRIDLSTAPVEEIAQQLTLIEWGLHDKIHLFDFLRKNPSEAPPIAAMVAQFNRISFWIATEIVKLATPKKRAHVIKQFITMAEYCASIANYNTVLEITAGLNLIAIRRLHKTWRHVPRKSWEGLEVLESMMSPHQNYKWYRQVLNENGGRGPCLPYLGVVTRDVTMIHVGNEDHCGNGRVNFEKGRLLWDVLGPWEDYQRVPYRFHKNPPLYNALQNVFAFDEDTLYQYSLQWEPREGSIPSSPSFPG